MNQQKTKEDKQSKKFNIIRSQENINQNYNDASIYFLEWLKLEGLIILSVDKDTEQLELSNIVNKNIKYYSHVGNLGVY